MLIPETINGLEAFRELALNKEPRNEFEREIYGAIMKNRRLSEFYFSIRALVIHIERHSFGDSLGHGLYKVYTESLVGKVIDEDQRSRIFDNPTAAEAIVLGRPEGSIYTDIVFDDPAKRLWYKGVDMVNVNPAQVELVFAIGIHNGRPTMSSIRETIADFTGGDPPAENTVLGRFEALCREMSEVAALEYGNDGKRYFLKGVRILVIA